MERISGRSDLLRGIASHFSPGFSFDFERRVGYIKLVEYLSFFGFYKGIFIIIIYISEHSFLSPGKNL